MIVQIKGEYEQPKSEHWIVTENGDRVNVVMVYCDKKGLKHECSMLDVPVHIFKMLLKAKWDENKKTPNRGVCYGD